MYAGRKRRKPVQRGVKQTPSEGGKSNPSKRHRDRLNSELDRLASLLPFPDEVTSSLDKLSILRLSVSYLRTKNFFSVALKTHACKGSTPNSDNHDNSKATRLVDGWMPEGELLLQALNGFVLVITAEGIIFYSSHTIQDYLGFHQTDVMHQSVFELIHTEDQQEFRRNLHWALNPPALAQPEHSLPDEEPLPSSSLVTYNPDQLPPENSSFLERSFVCRFRCLLDNSSGFLALNLQGRLKFLHGQNQRLDDGGNVPPQLALFAIATPLQPPSILEIRTKNMIFRTKHKLDFTPMACDAKGKIVLGYTEAELRVRGSGYQFIHAADMLYCAENHVRMIKTGESGLTVFRLLTKDNRWKWVQANARLVYKNGKPDYIIATQRPLVEEEGGEHLRKRSMHLPFTFATGEALLYQTSYPIHGLTDSLQGKGKSSKSKKGKADKTFKDSLDPSSLLGALMRQDESVYVCQPAVEPKMSFHSSLFSEQPGEGGDNGGFSGGRLGGDSWSAVLDGVPHPNGELSSFDPLLATLDSLSLEGGEGCSNSELFSALENLGLNAEDLELLLLDERMIRVEMDPDYIPSLNDLLTNNEILSFIHDSLESRTEEGRGDGCRPVPTVEPQTLAPAPASNPLPHTSTPAPQTPTPSQLPGHNRPPKPPPIVHLSQQMQQHLSTAPPVHAKAPAPWPPHPQTQGPTLTQAHTLPTSTLTQGHTLPTSTLTQGHTLPTSTLTQGHTLPTSTLTGVHNGHWVSPMELDDHCPLQEQQTLFNEKASLLSPHKYPQQWQAPDPLLLQLQSQSHFRQASSEGSSSLNGEQGGHPWQGYGYQGHLAPITNGVCIPNGHAAPSQTARTVNYNMADVAHVDGVAVSGGGTVGDGCHYQEVGPSGPSYLQGHQKQLQQLQFQSQVPSSGFPQYPTQTSSLELEQTLGLSHPQHLPVLETYDMFSNPANGSQDLARSKMVNDCPLDNTSVAYTGGRLRLNGNSSTLGGSPPTCPDTLPSLPTLPDPQATSFYL
ncbi:aryl hydrocarbon receptor 1b isoform X3 [Osmerus eperlanus]|uniref:aryl hydrocarbon receptor 1b isoform X3 n=1 Tax=Osmerus eperlanus TaxID=29151 RepID=UPI002E114E7F